MSIDKKYIKDAYEKSPNNATGKLVSELLTAFPGMEKPGNAAEVRINDRQFTVSISPSATLEARQFRENNHGLITYSVARNAVFMANKEILKLSSSPTRIAANGDKFFNAKANANDSFDENSFTFDQEMTIKTEEDEVYIVKTIYKTEDYSKFKSLEGQPRERAKKNAIKLSPEIKKTGGNYIPIIVNEHFEVIDGNTRLEACKSLNLPVIYEKISSDDTASLDLMKYMNAANNPWNIYNFIEFYALGYQDERFVEFKEFIDDNPYSIGIYTSFDSSISQDNVKQGILPEINYPAISEKLNLLTAISLIVGDSISSKQNIARALQRFISFGRFDTERLLSALTNHWFKILKKDKMNKVVGEYLVAVMLQKAYNYGLAKQNRTRLFEEEL